MLLLHFLGFSPTVLATTTSGELKKNPIVKDINTIVNFLGAAVGLIVVAMVIVGGIQYAIAGDNAQATAAAKKRIINALIALAAYIFLFAFIQWLVPGGVFNQ